MGAIYYRMLYSIGFCPWEAAAKDAQSQRTLDAVFSREEAGGTAPFGSVLDLGCGVGLHAIELERRGWRVTGIDIVGKAIRLARERARAAGVQPRFIHGDITRLPEEAGTGHDLIIDFGAFHGFSDAQRRALGREVTRVAAATATMLMVAFVPGKRGPAPRGASADDIRAALPEWELDKTTPLPDQKIGQINLHRLRRKP
jgi:SAM-dependent methyltransferase